MHESLQIEVAGSNNHVTWFAVTIEYKVLDVYALEPFLESLCDLQWVFPAIEHPSRVKTQADFGTGFGKERIQCSDTAECMSATVVVDGELDPVLPAERFCYWQATVGEVS